MAAVESYSPCPCGSGQKFKWCCQKVEAFADKSQRLVESGQVDAAIKALDEGLLKEPGNPWLLTRKAVIEVQAGQAEAAKAALREALVKNPTHFGALALLTRCVLETEGAVNGAGIFQQMLAALDKDAGLASLASLARVVAYMLNEARHFPAALKHLELSRMFGDPDGSSASAIRTIETNPDLSPWLKDSYVLASTPSHWTGEGRDLFEQALEKAARGLWANAAGIFDRVSGGEPGGEADYNLGLCRLWLGDEAGAIKPLRRRVVLLGTTTEAVDLEILCQQIAPVHPDDRVEQVQLTWPLRNRQALRDALEQAPDVVFDGEIPIDPDNPESPVVDQFIMLDRPEVKPQPEGTLSLATIPRILGRVGLFDEVAALETYDDGRVDSLGDQFTVLAGSAIVAAHPRTKVIGIISRSSLALTWEWLYPRQIAPEDAGRLEREQRSHVLSEIWPTTPMPYLNFRTPERAARDGNAEVPLRAALCQLEREQALTETDDALPLRRQLGIPSEPVIDPQTVDVARLPLGRLAEVPIAGLDDDRLVTLYRRVRRAMMPQTMEAAARAIAERGHLFDQGKIDPIAVFTDLASVAAGLRDGDGVRSWIGAGRKADTQANKIRNAPIWDMVEVRLRARIDRPEVWVPELAVVLERYQQRDSAANQVILMNLVEMGLVEMVPNPDKRGEVLLDSRPLQSVLAEYGPRVTTASGRLGISATNPDLWTPGSPAGGSGDAAGASLWTPGAGNPAPTAGPAGSGEKTKLILPGR